MVWYLTSCTDKDRIPKGVLGKEKMEQVLWDMIQAERYRETFILDSSKNFKTEQFKLYAQVFEINKVTKDEFIRSYKFYMSRPDIARDMFDSLASMANRRREDMYKPKPIDTAKAQQPAALPTKDTSKATQPQQVMPQPVPLPRPPFDSLRRIRNMHIPPRNLRISDTLLRLKHQP
jgi:hypothetical protein